MASKEGFSNEKVEGARVAKVAPGKSDIVSATRGRVE